MFISAPSVCRQWQRQGPPGRRSISHMVMVQPSGPSIHRGRYSGLVQASKTSRRGSLNSRVMTISWTVGIVTVMVGVVMAAPLATGYRPGYAGAPGLALGQNGTSRERSSRVGRGWLGARVFLPSGRLPGARSDGVRLV